MAVAALLAAQRDAGVSHSPALYAANEAVKAIAREESAHALLAWRSLAWAVQQSLEAAVAGDGGGGSSPQGGVREAVEAGLRNAKQSLSMSGAMNSSSRLVIAVVVTPSYGQLVREEDRTAVRDAVVRGLVVPGLEALLLRHQALSASRNGAAADHASAASAAPPAYAAIMTSVLDANGSAAEAAPAMMSAIKAALGHSDRGAMVFSERTGELGSRAEISGARKEASAGEPNDAEL